MKNKFAYIAGYIDGDGCFYIQKESNPIKYRAKLIISSTNQEPLYFFKENFGGHIRSMPIYNKEWKDQYNWVMYGKYAFELINLSFTFFVERKKEAKFFIEFILNSSKPLKQELIIKMKEHRNFNKHITKEIFEDIKNTDFKDNFSIDDAAYLAGFIDAECSLGIAKYKPKKGKNYTYKIVLQCNNTSPNIFYWFKEKLGGCVSFIHRNQKNPKHKNQIIWNLSANKLFPILEKIIPFLISKKEVCQKLIEFHQIRLPNGGDRQSKRFQETYDKLLVRREAIVDEVHKLNSKGVKNV